MIVHFNSQNELSSELQTQYRDENRYLALQADLTSASQVESLIHQVEEYLVQNNIELDTLIHNASCFWSDDTELSLIQRWQQTERLQAVHVLAPQAITSGLAHRFAKQGSIIALTDIYAELPNSRFASYCSAKAGLQNLALSWAQQLAPNIRVNTIQPGPIKFLPEHDESYQQMVLSQSLLGRELGYGAIQQGIDYLITGVGTGGHITGMAEVLKEKLPNIKVFAVEPDSSAVISGEKPGPHPLQGIGPGFIPDVFNKKIIDGALRVTKEEAFAEVKNIAKTEGILVGISTGASLAAVRKQLQTLNGQETILTMNYDTGERYLSIEGLLN